MEKGSNIQDNLYPSIQQISLYNKNSQTPATITSLPAHLALGSLGGLALAVRLVATVVTLALGLGEAVVLVGGLKKIWSVWSSFCRCRDD